MTVEFQVIDRLTWTKVYVNNPRGVRPLPFHWVYIQANETLARAIFEDRFKMSPDQVTCPCCGSDFSLFEEDGHLKDITQWERDDESLANFVRRDDVLVIYTRDRGEEI